MTQLKLKPEDVLKAWISGINNGDIDALSALYNDQALLIPTFSSRILNTPYKLREYFEKLKSRENLNVTLHEKTVKYQQLTDNIFTISGIYCWHFSIDDEPLSFEARFSYLLDLSLSQPIIHHHSSQIPRTL